MLPDRVSNPGPLTYESGALPIALRGPARLFRPVCTVTTEVIKRNFMQIEFRNMDLDATDIKKYILNHKDFKAAIPPYFDNQNPALIPYSYMPPIAITKIFH